MRTFQLQALGKKQVISYPEQVAVPEFTNEQERLTWIKHQVEQIAAREIEGVRRRLIVVKQSEKGTYFTG